ncbi:macro domain-containing protein [Candidatus Binatus sp.]|uniref:macro domain-containing protein n=2 Tax=Candidatus Binatus sp. TaxID=2811406 RepID=UPI003C6EA707
MTMSKDWRAKISLRQGDLTDADADAIVNAANNQLMLGGGVAGAIRIKGGPAIQNECDRIGPIALGEAAITGAGRLRARHVIHAASMRLGESTSEANLRAATRNSLTRADENALKTIAFPALGTGIAGFPIERCAQVMLEEVRAHLSGPTTLERIDFVLFDRRSLEIFELVLEKMK